MATDWNQLNSAQPLDSSGASFPGQGLDRMLSRSAPISRRQALQSLAASAAVAACHSVAVPRALAAGHTPPGVHFGVQLNAFPINPKRFDTFLEALAQVKQTGYEGFEAGYRFLQEQFPAPAEAHKAIQATGLTFFGIHIFMLDPQYDQATCIAPVSLYDQVARGGAALGAQRLILSGAPAVDSTHLKAKVEGLNAAGRCARAHGMTLAYHSHWWEFKSPVHEIEALYTETDPELVRFVLDAGHAFHAGADVPAFIRTYHKRIAGFHIRDFKNDEYVELGSGDFPLQKVADTIRELGWKGWVENEEERADHSQTGLKVIAPAYRTLMEAFKR